MRIPSNKLKDIIRFAHNELKDIYSEREIKTMIYELITHFTGLSQIIISSEPEKTILESDLLKLNFAIKDIKKEKPLQYIIGNTEFYGLKILLNNKVLIPRPETEELVDLIVKENIDNKDISIVDLCTGSGAIALALKHNLEDAQVWAYDISDEAITQTKENAMALKLNLNIIKADILTKSFSNTMFDIIVSNPPYVMNKEKEVMKNNVLNYEPHLALFVEDNNPLLFYKAIAEFAKTNLNKEGKIYLEINQQLSKETSELFSEYKTQIVKDFFGKERFIIAKKH